MARQKKKFGQTKRKKMARSFSPEKKQPLVVVVYYYDDHCTLNRRERDDPGNTGDDEDPSHLKQDWKTVTVLSFTVK